MSLKTRVLDDIKLAMKAKDSSTLSALRLLSAAIKQREVDERTELSDQDVIAVVDKLIKQRRESIIQFEAAGRTASADSERFELELLSRYLPEQLSERDLLTIIDNSFNSLNPQGIADLGKVIAYLKPSLSGRADMAKVSSLIKSRLQGSTPPTPPA